MILTKTKIHNIKASDLFTQDEINNIKFILKLFDGKVVKIEDKNDTKVS